MRVKNSYLICPLLKNSNFLWECSFFVLKMSAKNCDKIKPLGHISELALRKKLRFCMVWSKNQNRSRLSLNVTKLYGHLYKNTYRGCAKFRSIPNKSRFLKKNSTETRIVTIDEPNLSADEPAVVNCS